MCQEAFVQAFVKLESFGGRSTFYTWLYRIAFNLSVSRRRRERAEVSMDQHQQPHRRRTSGRRRRASRSRATRRTGATGAPGDQHAQR